MRGARFRRSTRHFLPLDASMRLSARLSSLCQQGMVDSLSVDMMVTLVRKVIPNYDVRALELGAAEDINQARQAAGSMAGARGCLNSSACLSWRA